MTQTANCWLIDFLDNLDKADLYMGRLRVVLWFVMLGYIVLHICGVAP